MSEVKEDQFKDTPQDNARRWTMELKAAREKLTPWHKEASEADDAQRMKRPSTDGETRKRLSFYPANIQTQRAAMYGRQPQVSSTRRFADADDDVARVASEIQERLLNTDMERDSDTSNEAFENANNDSLGADFGCVRLRYVSEFEDVPEVPAKKDPADVEIAPAVEAHRRKSNEDVEIDYVHWRDVLWGPSRVWADIPWIGFLGLWSRARLTKFVGEDAAKLIPLNAKHKADDGDARKAHPWDRAEVWEIWDKESERIFWVVEGYDSVLSPQGVEVDAGGGQPDPLGLDGFWPCPKFMVLNSTTSALVPKPDYVYAKTIYDALDMLETRCSMLVDSLGAKGIYDKSMGPKIEEILQAGENRLIPADNWAMFAEHGGIRGAIDWFPMEQVANTLAGLMQQFALKQDLLYQLTGRSDLERGMATQAGATATEQRAKVKYGSVRMQRRQNELARFVSDAQRIKAQIISKHFDAQTILDRCNCQYTPDFKQIDPKSGKPLPIAAVELLKTQAWQFRIEVKPEHLALQDFGALKEEALEVMTAVGGYTNMIAPLVDKLGPQSLPIFIDLLKAMLARIKGGSTFEGILDAGMAKLEQQQEQAAANPQQAAPDPKVVAQQMKGQQDLQKIQAESQADAQRIGLEVQADAMREATQRKENVMEHAAKAQITAALRPAPTPVRNGGQS